MLLQMRTGAVSSAAGLRQPLYCGQRPGMGQTAGKDEVKELELRQQQLQNTMLLMKASASDSSSLPEETQELLEREMEQVSLDLKAAKADEMRSSAPKMAEIPRLQKKEDPAPPPGDIVRRPYTDVYEREGPKPEAPGIYSIAGGKQGYQISFRPYSSERP